MEQFEHRRDRYEHFCRFANPTVNINLALDLPDFRPWCKERALPPFHVFLYCLLTSVRGVDNFLYRIHEGQVIKIDRFYASYTVINEDNNFNYARFTMSDVLNEFVERSVEAGKLARDSRALINHGGDLTARERKDNIFTTCMPWLDMRAIEHPIYNYQEADIPLVAWGKFSVPAGGRMTVPIAVQAHHGFVDGYHIHLLMQALTARVEALINTP